MSDVSEIHKKRLKELKELVEQSEEYFSDNVERYHRFRSFVFDTSLDQAQRNTLQELGKPTIEFNILEAFISLQRGEFVKQQPSLTVRAADGVPSKSLTPNFVETISVIEQHMRALFFDSASDHFSYNVFTDITTGGFSVARVYTDYLNEMSMDQNIYVDRVFDPTLCGFDPLARDSHKGDGRYCFEIFPMPRKKFEKTYGTEIASQMSYARNIEGFGWSYKNEKEDIILVCDIYEKKRKKQKIVKLSNGHTILKKEYTEFIEKLRENWTQYGVAQPPVIIEERTTYITHIERYRICEKEVLDHNVTNYKHLPLVFIDGNSITLTDGQMSRQMTRPIIYHAEGIQRLKNFAGQTLANELENMIQHKFIVAAESIPTDYTDAYEDVQKADVLIYNHFLDRNSPEIQLPAPREVVRTPIPPQISETFRMSDEMTQTILGSYSQAGQMARAEMSGVAVARNAMQGNLAAMPYIVGYIKGLNRMAEIVLDLIPKYYRTPRTLPILKPDGKREYVEVNKVGSLYMNYDPTSLQVKVEAGVNFAMQKEMALRTIIELMNASPTFAQMMNQEGLPVLLDNIDIRGIEELKLKASQFMEQEKQKQQQASQMQQQEMQIKQQQVKQSQELGQMQIAKLQKEVQSPTSTQIEAAKLQHLTSKDDAELKLKERQLEDNFVEIISKIRDNEVDAEIQQAKIDAENTRSAIDSAVAIDRHIRDTHGGVSNE